MDESQEIRTIAARLREERLRLKLTQPALAALGRVSKTTQSGYESALHAPDALYLARVDRHGINVQYVVTGESPSVRSGTDLNWDLLGELVALVDAFSAQATSPLDSVGKTRLLRVLYAATAASRRVDPTVVKAVLDAAA